MCLSVECAGIDCSIDEAILTPSLIITYEARRHASNSTTEQLQYDHTLSGSPTFVSSQEFISPSDTARMVAVQLQSET